MPVKVEAQAEPIPGYRLVERLGGGGFGEVWKAIAPGGLFKAIKFVYGDLSTGNSVQDDTRADQELKSLDRVKSVHHPYILSLERYDIIDGQLLIVMELADRTLGDRFKECRQQGLPGIPRDELLGYLREIAEALDLMNSQYGLQHLDIKPQNLFLCHNHVKVADFGLVKALEGKVATVTGGVTPVYAAPETFDGLVSRFTDQYSLAIVYQEMLTGQRPFMGTTMRQLVLQHLQSKPDLSSLPTRDRPVIARGLAKNPDRRYPNCLEMVEGLCEAKPSSGNSDIPECRVSLLPQQSTEDEASQPAGQPIANAAPAEEAEDTTTTRGIRRPAGSSKEAPRDLVEVSSLARAEFFTRRGGGAAAEPEIESAEAFSESYSTTTRRRARGGPSQLTDGVLQPAVIIGLGETGRNALKNLRREMYDQFGSSDLLPHIRFLHIDTDVDAPQAATTGPEDVSLRNSEVLVTKLQRASHYLKPRDGKVPVESWMNSKLLYHIPRQEKASAKLRALGRLAFVDHYKTISRRLESEIQACCDPQVIKKALEETGLKLRSSTPRVYIITSLAGGTGSGMFLDLGYVARNCLRRFANDRPEVVGVFLLPQVQGNSRSSGFANSVAALMELHYFSTADAEFNARYDLQDNKQASAHFKETGPAFQRCLLLPLPDLARPQRRSQNQKKPTDTLALAGQYVFADLTTPLGAAWDGEQRRGTRFRTCGMYRILWPRRQFLDKSSRLLCRKLIAHWMSKDARNVQADIEPWAQEQWDANGLRTESLITRHQEGCARVLKQSPETMFAGVLAPLATPPPPPGTAAPEANVNMTAVAQAMSCLEKMIGIPDECRPQTVAAGAVAEQPELGAIEKALAEAGAALASECEHKLSTLVVELIENPRFRLAGAEEAIRQFSAAVAKALEHHEQLAKELHERSVSVYERIHTLLDAPVPTTTTVSKSIWPFSRKAAASTPSGTGPQIFELVRAYPKCRYQSLVLSHITRMYVSLRGLLSDHMRELGFCRQRLTELTSWVENKPSFAGEELPQAAAPGLLAEQCLLPAGSSTVDDAVKSTVEAISPEDLQEFDRQIQTVLTKHFRALVHVCLAHSNVLKTLAPAMLIEAEEFVEKRIGEVNVVEMYLDRHQSEGDVLVTADLAAGFEQAATSLPSSSDAKEETFIAIPVGPAGDQLIEVAQKTLMAARFVRTDRHDLIALFRESGIQLADLEHLGPAGHEVYFAGADPTFLHTRVDITEWRPAAAS